MTWPRPQRSTAARVATTRLSHKMCNTREKQRVANLSEPVVVVVVCCLLSVVCCLLSWKRLKRGNVNINKVGSSPSRAPKTGAQLRENRRSAKNDANCVKKTLHRRHNQKCWKHRTRLCCTTGMSTKTGDELNLRHLHCAIPCR